MIEELVTTLKEKTLPPPYRVTQMDEQLAFEYGKGMKRILDEWKAKGYPCNCPDTLRPYFEGGMNDEAFKHALHEWYEKWDPIEQVRQLEACETVFNNGVKKYIPLQSWGFDIPDEYNVVVTPFAIGAGGAGQRMGEHGPVITMWYGRQWGKEGRTPEETLLHEAYHLGADEVIYKELGAAISDAAKYQQTKERIVDCCCAEVLVPDVLPLYHFQFSKQVDQPKDHLNNTFLYQTHLSVPQRLQLYAKSLKN
jgi:hypothetical protein